MSNQEQLQWEARLGRPVAIASFLAGSLLLVGTVVGQSILEDREDIEALPDSLLSVNESSGPVIAQGVLTGLSVLLLIPVFYYLFRATIQRAPQIPSWFVYLVVAGPMMYAISLVLGSLDRVDAAELFADQSYSFEDADPGDDPDLTQCPAIEGELGGDCASRLLTDQTTGISIGLGLAGTVSVAFLFVMLPLRARRAGLLSPFMSVLGAIAGVLIVLPLVPLMPQVLQAFWLGALGALFLGNWPGGRGPAWASGNADPWPSPAERRGLVPRPDGDQPGPGADRPGASNGSGELGADAEPAPVRPRSRKRKRKGR